jgi:hypothetical protein
LFGQQQYALAANGRNLVMVLENGAFEHGRFLFLKLSVWRYIYTAPNLEAWQWVTPHWKKFAKRVFFFRLQVNGCRNCRPDG